MNNDLNHSGTFLARGALQRVKDGKGTWVQCLEGNLWLTQEDDARDIVLAAGDEALIERAGTSVVSALSDSRFVLLRADAQAAVATRNGATVKLRLHA
jgi:hypothetical protein